MQKHADNNVMVSVIVLTYNQEKYIRQALDGILMQQVDFKYEILIGDDASWDGTPEILREYQARYPDVVKPVLREENVGPTKNAYGLFLAAQGSYLATCEGDDYWVDPNKLKKQVEFLNTHPEFIGCSHPCCVVDREGNALNRQRLRWECRKQIVTLKDYKGYYLPGQASTLVRRNLHRTNQTIDFSFFYKVHRFIGDRTTALIYLSQGSFYRFPEVMGCYRYGRSKDSVTAQVYLDNLNCLQEDLAYTKRLMEFASENLCVTVDFCCYLSGLFVSALLEVIKYRRKESVQQLACVLEAFPNKRKAILSVPLAFLKKLINKLFFLA